jgi:hypothetical protein
MIVTQPATTRWDNDFAIPRPGNMFPTFPADGSAAVGCDEDFRTDHHG